MIDAPLRTHSDQRLGMKRHSHSGRGQHRQIVCAVADCHRLLQRNLVLGRESQQRPALGLAGDDRRLHGTGDAPCPQIEPIGDQVVETELGGNPFGKDGEPARNESGHGSVRSHSCDQFPCAGREPNAAGRFFEDVILDPLKQADARLEGSDKSDLTVHSATGDCRNLGPKPKKICQLVEHFVLDDGRFHIGDEKALAPIRQRLDKHIDGHPADHGPRRLFDSGEIETFEHEVKGLARRKPFRLCRDPEAVHDRHGNAIEPRHVAVTGDQGEDSAHKARSYSGNRRRNKPLVIVIAGPTASGKSRLALELAEALGGVIINADALQVYRDLRILSARPDEAAERRVPHRLYGFLDASERGSAARWRDLALAEIATAITEGRLPIVVGGTGLYLRALKEGLAPVPEIPEQIRQEVVDLHGALGGAAFRERLAQLDPDAAERLVPGDSQRLVRAFEVVRATGVPIGTWQQRAGRTPAYRFGTILLEPPRDRLYRDCDARFLRMLEAGALAEAAALAARRLNPDLPAMKALGLPEVLSHLRKEMPLVQAISAAQRSTRRYAKRQMTWFRHQMKAGVVLDAQFSESLLRCSRHFIDQFLLTAPE